MLFFATYLDFSASSSRRTASASLLAASASALAVARSAPTLSRVLLALAADSAARAWGDCETIEAVLQISKRGAGRDSVCLVLCKMNKAIK